MQSPVYRITVSSPFGRLNKLYDFYALVIKHDFIVPGNGFVSLLSIL